MFKHRDDDSLRRMKGTVRSLRMMTAAVRKTGEWERGNGTENGRGVTKLKLSAEL